ncbi:hypothetical protein [Bacteroides congonensis]|uniref:hypothetical protein n=1 Tax=Bacteroides congonensis TaxID=1871006 RepID=UPI001E2BBA11|nr:hypothetical protein [Bacteroides congonensis]
MKTFNLSANIENSSFEKEQYIVTPNTQRAVQSIINDFQSGIHAFTIIGSYGTGKSSFLLAFEADLDKNNKQKRLFNPHNLSFTKDYEILNIVGDYTELSTLLRRKLRIEGHDNSILDELKEYHNKLKAQNKFLLIAIDEFGKVLEHAAKNNPEQELYFMQKFAEFVNVQSNQILLLTTLHQNFSSYAKELTETQKNEWTKVKGRFKEITFVEPIEQILYLASKQIQERKEITIGSNTDKLYNLAKETGFISNSISNVTARQLYPLDMFSAYSITSAITRYGQNERSLFTFLFSKGVNSFLDFTPHNNSTFNLQNVYDYIVYNFYSYLKDANADSMSWSSMQVSIERVEGLDWESKNQMQDAIAIIKAIGLLNLYSIASFKLTQKQMAEYAYWAMNISNAELIINKLIQFKIIRYASYKQRLMLFQGTDMDLEAEIDKAGVVVSRPIVFIDDLNLFFNKRISPVKAHYYHRGTPRFFDYEILEEPLDIVPTGDTDGYIELIFSSKKNALEQIMKFSAENKHALIFAFFNNTDEILDHLHNIKKYQYILDKVLIDKGDQVAVNEITKLKEYEEILLNKAISDNLFAYKNRVTWIFKGEKQKVNSHRDFNVLLSTVCDKVYSETPIMNNELFNKQKLSGTISAARKNFLRALIEHSTEINLGFDADKYPPEKTIYFSLLKNTGLHVNGEFSDVPSDPNFMSLWTASENFLQTSVHKARKISEFIKILSSQPYKLKQGFIDFWVPTYLFIKRQDYALYSISMGAYMPNVNIEFFELLQKHPSDFEIKAFAVDGVKLSFFNQYRRFVNLGDEFNIKSDKFIETIKPFLFFYKQLNDYSKYTRKFAHQSTIRFRDILATAKDPEKAFFEDLPEALGYDSSSLKQKNFIEEYGNIIQKAIRELRSCYTQLLDRIEERLVDSLGLQSYEYNEYVSEIQKKLRGVKVYLLTEKQKEFYHHVMTEYENRTLWYQSICYTVLEHRLDSLRDEQEDKLVDDLIYLFRECEKYADISRKTDDINKDEAYSFDMVTNRGINLRTQTYILPEKDKLRAVKLEEKINQILSGDNNIDVCTLLAVLNKKINK